MKITMKRFLSLVLVLALSLTMAPGIFAASGVAVSNTNFPDANFRSYVSENFDTDSDGYLSDSEIASAQSVNVSEKGISSLKGIEYLTALTYLRCDRNDLSSIDISKNTRLEEIYCIETGLTSLNVSNNTRLETLYCWGNELTSLNISRNTGLEVLCCQHNKITALDVSKNVELGVLYCFDNKISTLDVSRNTKIDQLDVAKNSLSSFDVSKLPELFYFDCEGNKLTALDVSNNPKLEFLSTEHNQLKTLNISNCPYIVTAYTYGDLNPDVDYKEWSYKTSQAVWQHYYLSTDNDTVVSTSPAAPGVSLTNGDTNNGITVKWTGSDCYSKYRIQRKATGESSWTMITSAATGSSYTDKAANVGGATYTYRVAGYNGSWGDYSETVSIVRNPFKDVKTSASYFKALCWAYNNGIVAGTSTTTFSPNDNCTRGQFALMLWRMNGKPDTTGLPNPFKDVKSSNGFYKGIVWCYSKGITAGTSDTTYSPNNNITRWQMILMLWRMRGKPNSTLTKNPFTDVKTTASYYKAALWAYEKKITGVETFSPNDLCTRWQLVLFLYRINNLGDDCGHHNTEVRDAKAATYDEDGYTGDTYCTDCGVRMAKGEVIPKLVLYTTTDPSGEAAMLARINELRAEAGVDPLAAPTDEMYHAAVIRANELIQSYSHTRPDGSRCFTVASRACGENIWKVPDDYTWEQILQGWLDSEGHYENIMRPSFKSLAIALLHVGGKIYCEQLFFY